MPDSSWTVKERTTAVYRATIQDETGAALGAALLTTLTLTLYDEQTGTILNARSAQNVLNANNVVVDANGVLTWTMQPADNALVTSTQVVERHIALFTFTWSGGTKTGRWEAAFTIANLGQVS